MSSNLSFNKLWSLCKLTAIIIILSSLLSSFLELTSSTEGDHVGVLSFDTLFSLDVSLTVACLVTDDVNANASLVLFLQMLVTDLATQAYSTVISLVSVSFMCLTPALSYHSSRVAFALVISFMTYFDGSNMMVEVFSMLSIPQAHPSAIL